MRTSKRNIIIGAVLAVAGIGGVAIAFYFIGHHTVKKDERITDVSQPGSRGEDKQDGRLPRAIEPLVYQIELFPDIYGSDPTLFTFEGFLSLHFRCTEYTQNITLNINNLNITEGSINVRVVGTNDEIRVSGYTIDTKWQFITVNLATSLNKNTVYIVQMNYTGPLKTDFAGLYLSTFQHRTSNRHVAATQFSPTDARKAFPCLDEPDRKAKFDITLIRREDFVSLSNMPKLRQMPRENGFVADIYKRTPKMSSYLIAMVVGDLVPRTIPARRGLNFTAWASQETIDKTEMALRVGANALTFFEQYFGIEFPLQKQDILALPETAVGAMENWGLIIFNDQRIFYNDTEYSINSLKNTVITVVHEVSHQWFGNLVTMDWWSDLMLKEGFATYFENIGTGHIFPEWNILAEYPVMYMHAVFETDGLVSSHPVYKELFDTTQIRQVFDAISYTKGGCMIRMLNFILGEKSFQDGLKHYLNTHKYDSVGHADLWTALESRRQHADTIQPSIKAIMDTWILQKNYPVVTITQVRKGTLHVKQERFLNNGMQGKTANDSESPFKYIWKIPLTFTNSSLPRFDQNYTDIMWMVSKELYILDSDLPDFHLPGKWLVANVNQWGYYRVNYDMGIWTNLIDQLMKNHTEIDAVSRAQIINDLFSLGKAGVVNFSLALDSLKYMHREQQFIPWIAAMREIRYLEKLLKNDQIFTPFKDKVLKLIQKLFKTYQKNFKNLTMTQLETYVRVFSIACKYGMTDCIGQSVKLFNNWKESDTLHALDPNLRSTIICTAVKHGNETDWSFVLRQYNTTLNPNEKSTYLNALTCAKDNVLQIRLIDLSMDVNTIQGSDAISALTGLARNPLAVNKVWRHVTQNWNKFMDVYAGSLFLLSRLARGITEPFTTREQLHELQTFLNNTPELGPAEQAFNQAKEDIKSNIAWLTNRYNDVEQWVMTPLVL